MLLQKQQMMTPLKIIALPIALVIIQTFYLLPLLDERAQLIMKGESVSKSYAHLIYVLFEIIKALTLLWTGMNIAKIKQSLL